MVVADVDTGRATGLARAGADGATGAVVGAGGWIVELADAGAAASVVDGEAGGSDGAGTETAGPSGAAGEGG